MIACSLIFLALSSASQADGIHYASEGRFLAVKTNVVPWAAGIANIGGEVQIGRHFSIDLPVWWSPYFISNKYALRTFMCQPEFRYWTGHAGTGHFFGIHAGVASYNIKWDDIRYQDTGTPLLNGGISYGYSLRLSSHLNAEFTIGAGYAKTMFVRYYNIDNGAKIDIRKTTYRGIDRVGITLVYHFNL